MTTATPAPNARRVWIIGSLTVPLAAAGIVFGPHDLVAGLVVGVALALLGIPIARFAARSEEPAVQRMILGALFLKLLFALVNYAVALGVYGNAVDATAYHRVGATVAAAIHSRAPLPLQHTLVGTNFVNLLTGVAYLVISPTLVGGSLLFSWLGFWGLVLFYRAFRLAVPTGNARRYAALVLFLPSLLFWSSTIGKDALMTLGLGLAAYGFARYVAGKHLGVHVLILGFALSAMVRPHVALTLVMAMGAALAFAGRPRVSRRLARGRLIPVALTIIGMTLLLGQTQRYLNFDASSASSVGSTLNKVASDTDRGGSASRGVRASSVLQIPQAVFTVLFRPVIVEARTAPSLLASLEGTFLLAFFLRHWQTVRRVAIDFWTHAYVAMSVWYAVLFCIAFSNIGNLGIVARERTQVLPLALVLLCLPTPVAAPRRQPVESAVA